MEYLSYRNWYLPRNGSCSRTRDAKLLFRDTFKAVHDLTELALPTLLLLQCLPLLHLTVTKGPQGPCRFSNS